jgi:hypothetical protein
MMGTYYPGGIAGGAGWVEDKANLDSITLSIASITSIVSKYNDHPRVSSKIGLSKTEERKVMGALAPASRQPA